MPPTRTYISKTAITIILFFFLALSATGCSGPWNNPNPPEQTEETVYYGSFSTRLQHLDPVRSYSAEEALFIDQIYEAPYRYHFLKRPYVLEESLARTLPEVGYFNENMEPVKSDDPTLAYSLYTIRLKQDVFYQPHPALAVNDNGQPLYLFKNSEDSEPYKTLYDFPKNGTRHLKAEDFVYGIKRLADPTNKSPLLSFLSDYIVGMKSFSQSAMDAYKNNSNGWIDLRQLSFTGVKAVDKNTLTILINGRYPQFQYWLATHFFSPIPWEADRFYHNPGFQERNLTLDWYPLGTGAYMMVKNDPNSGIILERNPNYRLDLYPNEGEPGDRERRLLVDAGKALPFIDKAIFRLEKESLPQWSKFMQGWYDRSGDDSHNISSSNFDRAFTVSGDGINLSQEMVDRGITVSTELKPSIYYYGFNMNDPVVGGYTEDKQKLRRAISIAMNTEEMLEIFANGRGEAAQGPIPPGLPGYVAGKKGINPYVYDWINGKPKRKSIDEAKRLLAQAGYPNGRNRETGKPLILYMDTTAAGGPIADWRKRQFEKLGIQLEYRSSDYVRFKEKMRKGNTQIFAWGWLADYPDPENFLFLLDGDQASANCNCDGANTSNYDNPEFNKLFRQMKTMENSEERNAILNQMVDMVRRDAPWFGAYHSKEYYLNNSWVTNTKRHGIAKDTLKYLRLDRELRKEKQQEWNKPVLWPLLVGLLALIALTFPTIRAYQRRQTLRINHISLQQQNDKNQKGE